MSRATVQDKSTDVSLFPFLAVLLCTMGSLLVVLVGVTRLSHNQAAEQAALEPAAVVVPDQDAEQLVQKLQEVQQYSAYLDQVRGDAHEKLRNDQQRLSHIEDHIRRLGEQLLSLKHAASELAALEDVHSHDRDRAEQEVARLERLIEETRENIDELKADESLKHRSYAVVPYVGKNGTRRRPIYIECRKQQVILQPEGIELTPDDFLPPLGPGNPLASALRAAREHILREDPAAGADKDLEPYPLILVRPDGIAAYYRVRDAIESWDADFGYELIDGNWDLEFPPPNPQLAEAEYRAVSMARARERMLAEAAPRAYGPARSARGAAFDDGMPRGGGGGGGEFSGGEPGGGNGYGQGGRAEGSLLGDEAGGEPSGDAMIIGSTGGEGDYGRGGEFGGKGDGGSGAFAGSEGPQLSGPGGEARDGEPGSGEDLQAMTNGTSGQNPGGGSNKRGGGASAESGSNQPGEMEYAADGSQSGSPGSPGGATSSGAVASGMSSTAASSGGSPMPGSGPSAGGQPQSHPGVVSFEQTFGQDPQDTSGSAGSTGPRGKDWAIGGVNRDAVPIRRSIQVIVRQDHISILPELSKSGETIVNGKEIPLQGSTAAVINDVVKALQDTMLDWGIAGQGLYWRPVLVLNVGPDGQRRADDLTKLLHNSGMELRRASATALHDEGNSSSATR